MVWLVTGANGMLGHEVVARARERGHDVAALGHRDLDICRPDRIDAAFRALAPRVVVNCAAWTAVDAAEDHEPEAHRVNADGPRFLAAACARHGARLVHISTDYVFPGDATVPYREDHPAGSRTAYGRTKLAGEEAVLGLLPSAAIVRTAWLYGAHGSNFVRTMLRLMAERQTVDVVDDQRGQPTWAADLADRLVTIGGLGSATGRFHATNSGDTTWFEFAREIFRLAGADPDRVRPTTSAAFGSPVDRPAFSVLDDTRSPEMGLEPLRPWRDALRAARLDPSGRLVRR
ncbi:dTDP-4-dehydrorhamnose reductase [Streptosporangium sp. NPDC050855]|uniref:dTDP-4-dehydrorhamnose reductase n=1 Tax=Streptosporangium sp. NPDC050855 TaxID=3366194 RepID=UPI0037A605DC